MLEKWKRRAGRLKEEVHAIYLAARDPRVPWYAKLLAACVVAYALSPIDLIPDFIPVLGYLDDLVLVPLGIYFILKMIPAEVMAECRAKTQATMSQTQPSRLAAGVVIAIWIAATATVVFLFFGGPDIRLAIHTILELPAAILIHR
ncbi:MAG: YkvA family protein [Candidatus Binatia bacterium]